MNVSEVRWKQRFQNFSKAFLLLKSSFDSRTIEQFSDLEKEGIVQRFEYTFELGWKTIKDYLEYSGIVLEQFTPRHIIKKAFAAKIIQNGQIWIDMLEQRNVMSHTYDKEVFEKSVIEIAKNFIEPLNELWLFLKEKNDLT